MAQEKNWFERFSQLMDQNIRGVQYGIYTISGLALFLAVRTARPFVKFVRPSDIPKHFFYDKQSFIGKVVKVEYSSDPGRNPLLLVDHYPLIALPWKKTNAPLPVEVASVELTLNGFSWMQRMLVGDKISFTPLRIDNDRVYSILYNSEKRNIGCQLVSIGLATVSEIDSKLKKDPFYLKYYKNLLAEEEKAENNRAGIWANSEVSSSSLLLRKLLFFRKKPLTPRRLNREPTLFQRLNLLNRVKSLISYKKKS